MRKIVSATISLILLFVAQSVLAQPNLVANGGFEEPVVTDPAQWDIFSSGTGGLGWTVEWRSDIPSYWPNPGNWDRPDPALQELQAGVNGWLPQEGAQYTELDSDWYGPGHPQNGEPASIKIYQNLSTGAGCKYELKFYFSPRPGTGADDNILEVKWKGVVLDTLSRTGGSQTDWSEHTYTVTASGATTRLEFTDLGTANSLGTFLDNVSVVKVFCPIRGGDIEVDTDNCAVVKNDVTVVADTGDNEIEGGKGFIMTGDAGALADVFTVTNENITRIKAPCADCSGDVTVDNDNHAFVKNDVTVVADTGDNEIESSGHHHGGSGGGFILTGDAGALATVVTKTNINLTRIRR